MPQNKDDTPLLDEVGRIVSAAVPEFRDWLANSAIPEAVALQHLTRSAALFQSFTNQALSDLGEEWTEIHESVRHGLLRLAALEYRQGQLDAHLPAAVAALWRPWRILTEGHSHGE
jgi:hypothetical protein